MAAGAVIACAVNLPADTDGKLIPARVSSVDSSEIADFDQAPKPVRDLLEQALALTRQNLGYRFGSSDPSRRGMDCSGTIFFLLRQAGFDDVPRSSNGIYLWTLEEGTLQPVGASSLDSASFHALRPGDLLFWSGTYNAGGRQVVTHAMLYLGKARSDGRPLMVGASDGRTYRGEKRFGVSVFDFRLPKPGDRSRFVGYARIPGLVAAGSGDG